MALKYKLFRDPVHGDIEVERWICTTFIDSDVFQRLRFIEQSSMRMLFPGARHDRFIHSLGTFLMAKRIFDSLRDSLRVNFEEEQIHEFRNTFVIAALLHDCAHSPFSHTGEVLATDYCLEDIDCLLTEMVKDKDSRFAQDFACSNSATHEKASAFVAYARFSRVFAAHSINAVQLVRMIIGVKNSDVNGNLVLGVYNCLISLINGFVVDVDRLDYLERDTWATGIRNASVDIERLISGIEIDFSSGEVVMTHRAMPSLLNAVAARDYIYQWVIPHHKVAYANEMLVRALEELMEVLSKHTQRSGRSKKTKVEVGKLLFSPKRLLPGGKVKICSEVIYLPTDGDLVYLMKKYIPDSLFFRAYFERCQSHLSLWKTHAEFMQIFNPSKLEGTQKEDFWEMFSNRAKKICKRYRGFCTDACQIKVSKKKVSDVSFYLNGDVSKPLNLDYLFERKKNMEQNIYYMNAYIEKSEATKCNKLVAALKKCFIQCVDEYNKS